MAKKRAKDLPANERPISRLPSVAMAIASAKAAEDEMFHASTQSCERAIDGVEQASIKYGYASSRLHGSHPKMSASYRRMMESLERIKKRCGGSK